LAKRLIRVYERDVTKERRAERCRIKDFLIDS